MIFVTVCFVETLEHIYYIFTFMIIVKHFKWATYSKLYQLQHLIK